MDLFNDNTKRFETTGYGATIFGTLTVDSLEVVGVTTVQGDLNLGDNQDYQHWFW